MEALLKQSYNGIGVPEVPLFDPKKAGLRAFQAYFLTSLPIIIYGYRGPTRFPSLIRHN